MRAIPVAALVALAAAAGALEADFQELRMSAGMASGFSSGEIRRSELFGALDATYDGKVEYRQDPGLDFQLGPHLGEEFGDGVGLSFGADFVCRLPGGEGTRTVDTGGGTSRTDHFRVRGLMFGAEFEAGVYWVAGPVRIEVSPFLGAGYLRARFDQRTVHVGGGVPDQDVDYHDSGAYFSYGASVGVFVETVDWLLLGANGGYLASRGTVRTDQKPGGEIASAEHVLDQNGWFLGGVAIWAF